MEAQEVSPQDVGEELVPDHRRFFGARPQNGKGPFESPGQGLSSRPYQGDPCIGEGA